MIFIFVGNKFFVVTKESNVASIQEKVEMAGLLNIHTQWLYLVTDSNENSEIIAEQIKKSKDGHNLAFLYNASSPDVSECRVSFYNVTVILLYISGISEVGLGLGTHKLFL